MAKKDNLICSVLVFIFFIIAVIYIGSLFFPVRIFVKNPEFLQDTTGILNNEDKEWIYEQIKKVAKKENIGILLDCQRVEFETDEVYLNNVLARVVTKPKEIKYFVITYFSDTKKIKIFSNLENEKIDSYEIENISDTDELLKEVSFIVMKKINNN